jgi:hypothetical protein
MQDGVTLRNLVYPYQITQATSVVDRTAFDHRDRI